MKRNKLLIAISVVLILILVLLASLLVHNTIKSPQESITPSSTTTTTAKPSSTTTTTAKPNSTTTTKPGSTTTTKENIGNPDSSESYPKVYDIFLYDIDPDNNGYRILGLDPDFLNWQSPPNELVIPQKIDGVQVTAIGNSAFKGVQSQKIVLPEGLLDIYKNAFYNSGAQQIDIPSTVIYIGSAAFQKCHFLKKVTIPNGVDMIRDNTFRECTYLESVTLPDTLEYIGHYAFAQLETLTYIKIPSECDVESTTFNNSPNLNVE